MLPAISPAILKMLEARTAESKILSTARQAPRIPSNISPQPTLTAK